MSLKLLLILTLSSPKSWLSRYLVKDYTETNINFRRLLLRDRYYLSIRFAKPLRKRCGGCFTMRHWQIGGNFSRGECYKSSPRIKSESGKRFSMAADLHHNVQPSSLHLTDGPWAIALVRALAPRADSFRTASL